MLQTELPAAALEALRDLSCGALVSRTGAQDWKLRLFAAEYGFVSRLAAARDDAESNADLMSDVPLGLPLERFGMSAVGWSHPPV